MADESVSQNLPENPDSQEKPSPGDDITPSQEQRIVLNKPPNNLVDWLVRSYSHLTELEKK